MDHLLLGWEHALASVLLLSILAWITWSDLSSLRIPDRASLPLIAAGLLLSALPGGISFSAALIGAVAGYMSFAAVGDWYYQRTGQDGLGLGDAKLLAAAGAWLGWQNLPLLVAIAATTATAFALVSKRRQLAFGPWLSGAFCLLWVQHLAQ